jgi:hypothetical protein
MPYRKLFSRRVREDRAYDPYKLYATVEGV